MKTALTLIILLPVAGSALALLLGRLLPRRALEATACAAVWGSFLAALAAGASYSGAAVVGAGEWFSVFGLQAPVTLSIDPLSLVLVLMVTFVCGLIHLYSVGYMKDDPGYVRYFALLNLFTGAMLLLILAENLPLLYLGWEGVGFCSYALIGFWYEEPENASAGRKAFIVTRIGDIGLAIAIFWLYTLFATFSIGQLNQAAGSLGGPTLTALGLLLLLGAIGKSAQVPLMVWLPDAMAGPTPVSAQIHAATMVTAGVYLLMRLFPLISLSPTVTAAIGLLGALTAFYGATCAMAERNLKRILAYSTMSQLGYMMLAVGCGAITAATFHLVVHAFFKALLFLVAGCLISALHHEQDIFAMAGRRSRLAPYFWPFLAGALCLAGLPPTGGFFSKEAVLGAVWAEGGLFHRGLYLVGLATVLLTAFYTFRMFFLLFVTPPAPGDQAEEEAAPPVRLPKIMTVTLLPLALLALAGGVLDLPPWLGEGFLRSLLAPLLPAGAEHGTDTGLGLQIVAIAASLAGLLLAWFLYSGTAGARRRARAGEPAAGLTAFLQAGWYIDAFYRAVFVRPFEGLAGRLWQSFDEGVIDDSLDRLANRCGLFGRLLGSWSNGRISLYMLSLAAGAALMLGWFAVEVL